MRFLVGTVAHTDFLCKALPHRKEQVNSRATFFIAEHIVSAIESRRTTPNSQFRAEGDLHMRRCFPWIAICFCASILSVFAQTDRGTITGTVSDPTGAVIPGVAIEAKD